MGDARVGGEQIGIFGFANQLPPAAILGLPCIAAAAAGGSLTSARKTRNPRDEPRDDERSKVSGLFYFRRLRGISPLSRSASMQRGDSRLPAWRMQLRSPAEPTS